ncbi:hypothetical protein CRG98_016278 [Punica granatum]|uniref:Uncharacterized protein n=1 Tax=Punica granatum TaxID=22663 RepID=A0A2I0K400_PUNGR|nr:hypothetical protein CRG98_016278 [Punica granatum]
MPLDRAALGIHVSIIQARKVPEESWEPTRFVKEVASPSGSARDQLRTGEAECLNPEAVEDSCVCHDGLQLNGDNSSSTANSDLECMEDLDSSLGESRVDQNIMISPVCIPHLLANGGDQSVQLFRGGKWQIRKSSIGDPDYLKTYESIFPLLVPRAGKDDIASQTVESAESHESELIFEYFELEPPQQRRPLYEKFYHVRIQELVTGDGPSRDKAYGDSSELNSINLQDLDPRSWYSVAWYPIYRIPDGDFRAAFLTYHSLGHFVRRDGLDNCVASPVAGLQSYNAQNEC